MHTWVIGSGGLLGSALAGRTDAWNAAPLPWGTGAIHGVLEQGLAGFTRACGDDPWSIAWCAGAAVVATPEPAMDAELDVLQAFLALLRDRHPPGPGAVFLASSAGGAYAGSSPPPFSDLTLPVPVGAYGRLKVRQEEAAHQALAGVIPLVIGRIANLYGPGQNPRKQQGLISALCRAAASGQAMSIYVPLATIRDYIYADDAARIISAFLTDAARQASPMPRTVVVASGQPVSIAELIDLTERVTHRRIPIAFGQHAASSQQAIDLRLVPSPLPDGIHVELTPLAAGIRRTFDAMVTQPLVG